MIFAIMTPYDVSSEEVEAKQPKWKTFNRILLNTKFKSDGFLDKGQTEIESVKLIQSLVTFINSAHDLSFEVRIEAAAGAKVTKGAFIQLKDVQKCKNLREVLNFVVEKNRWNFRIKEGVLEIHQERPIAK